MIPRLRINLTPAFKTKFRGFEIEADQSMGNALMAFGIYNNPKSKLAIYYHSTKDGKSDTTVNYFLFTNSSASHNYVNRYGFSGHRFTYKVK
jgi:hypothetical protein